MRGVCGPMPGMPNAVTIACGKRKMLGIEKKRKGKPPFHPLTYGLGRCTVSFGTPYALAITFTSINGDEKNARRLWSHVRHAERCDNRLRKKEDAQDWKKRKGKPPFRR